MKKIIVSLLAIFLFTFSFQNNSFADEMVDAKTFHTDYLLRNAFSDFDRIKVENQQAVAYFTEKKVINGVEENGRTLFKPSDKLTRAQAAKIISLGLNLPNGAAVSYKDTKNHWALNDIQKVTAAKLMTGMSSSSFGPEATLTNAQIVTIVERAIKISGKADLSSVKDITTKHWAYDAFSKLVSANIVTPIDGKLNPDDPVTREQFSAMLYKALQFDGKITQHQIPANSVASWPFLTQDFTSEREVIGYELDVTDLMNVAIDNKLTYVVKLGDEEYPRLGHEMGKDGAGILFYLLNSIESKGLEVNYIGRNGRTIYQLIPTDPAKKLSILPVTEETIKKYRTIPSDYIAPPHIVDFLEKSFPKEIDFMKDGQKLQVKGNAELQFTIEYNGKIDTIRLNDVYLNFEKLLQDINKQIVNTNVRVDNFWPRAMFEYARFYATDYVEGAQITIKGAESIFKTFKVTPAGKY